MIRRGTVSPFQQPSERRIVSPWCNVTNRRGSTPAADQAGRKMAATSGKTMRSVGRLRRSGVIRGWSPEVPGVRHDPESFPPGGLTQAPVDANEVVTRWATSGPGKGRCELQGVRGPERMEEQDAPRGLPDLVPGQDLGPRFGQLEQNPAGSSFGVGIEMSVPPQSRERRPALDGGSPPGNSHKRIGINRNRQPATMKE